MKFPFFSRFFKVYTPDLPGFVSEPERAYSLDDYASAVDEYLSAVIKETGKTPSVIAHSFGARIVFRLAPTDKIDKLVLTGAAGVKMKRSLRVKLKILAYKSIKRVFHVRLTALESSDYKRLSPVMRESFNKIIAVDLTDRLQYIKNKTLIINGDNDRETPPRTARVINKRVKGSQLVFIKGAGHFCFVDDPATFNITVKEFLS